MHLPRTLPDTIDWQMKDRYRFGVRFIRGCGTVGTPTSSSGSFSGENDTCSVSFLNTKENISYAPSPLIPLSPPLSSHPYSCHLTSSSPTQTHYFNNQTSNAILPFSLALDYINCLTQVFLYHNELFLSNGSGSFSLL